MVKSAETVAESIVAAPAYSATKAPALRLGIVNPETWAFMGSLHEYLQRKYATTTFEPRAVSLPVFHERLTRSMLQRDLKTFLRRHDVVFFEWASEMLVRASHLPKNCRIVTRLHRYELYSWADRINWDAVDRVILVSEAKRKEFGARFPAHASKARVISAAISLPRFTAKDRGQLSGAVGTLCHLHPRKRVYDLILAFKQVAERVPSLRLRIGGDPDPHHRDYYEAMVRLVAKLGLESQVFFDGPIAKPWEWYPKIDVFVSNSYSEGLQVAAMEAMAAGCHVLSHAWDGAEELLPDECLYLTDCEMAARVEAFYQLSANDRFLQQLMMQRRAGELFDADTINERIGAVIDECISAA
jgi:glycosyltransferase involved in cell wall biosynthesis